MPGVPFLVNWIPRSDGDQFNWQLRWPSRWPTCQQLWDWQAFYMVLVWVSFQAGLALLPFGKVKSFVYHFSPIKKQLNKSMC